MADTTDLKSVACMSVPVQVRPRAPISVGNNLSYELGRNMRPYFNIGGNTNEIKSISFLYRTITSIILSFCCLLRGDNHGSIY